mmetsp:Transcript_33381/g.41049  ORF Transcript_33381/g.41049 Transcript_33381/m.41049 type:complete len:198 (+) Transcript_33381:32-625(+)
MGNDPGKRESLHTSKVNNKLRNLDNLYIYAAKHLLPQYDKSFEWNVYLDKKPIWGLFKGITPHEKLIIQLRHNKSKYKTLAIELGTNGRLTDIHEKRKNWSVFISLVHDNNTKNWSKQGHANFSLEMLSFYIEEVTAKFGNYNVLTSNCQTFARKIIHEIGNMKVTKLNDATKIIGSSGAVSSAISGCIIGGILGGK